MRITQKKNPQRLDAGQKLMITSQPIVPKPNEIAAIRARVNLTGGIGLPQPDHRQDGRPAGRLAVFVILPEASLDA
jgi:hypothetical protein